jgi:hypothetical protein
MTKEFQFYNKFDHYGDAIFNLRFFYNIDSLLQENTITILYFYNSDYIHCIKELERYVNPSTVTLVPFGDPKMKTPIHLCIGDDIDGVNVYDFIEYFQRFYQKISTILGISVPSEYTTLFQPEYYLKSIYDTIDTKFHDLDILILNSKPQSRQFVFRKPLLNRLCMDLKELSLNIATTTFVQNTIPCTYNTFLTIQDIGAISTRAKYIIAVLSGPMTSCFNALTFANVHTVYILCTPSFTFRDTKIKTFDRIRTLRSALCKDLNIQI